MSKHHNLKCLPCYFKDVANGTKTFEIRNDKDRAFQKGDTFTLKEFEPGDMLKPNRYTGKEVTNKITYVTAFGQKEGFVVFGFDPGETEGDFTD